MSVEAVAWALSVPIGGNAKVVLIGLANHATAEFDEARPAVGTLARYAHCDPRTVQRHLRNLEAEGWIQTTGHHAIGGRADRSVTVYRLTGRQKVTPQLTRDDSGVADGVTAVSPEPSLQNRPTLSARTRELFEVLDLDQLQAGERRVVEILRFVASEKAADLNERRVLQILKDYPDRDHVGEVEKFEHWHLQGKGQNVQRRNLTTAWRNWLDQASPLERKGAVGGARRRPSNEQEVAERLYPGDADAAKAVRGAMSWGAATDDGVREWIKEWRPDIHERWSA